MLTPKDPGVILECKVGKTAELGALQIQNKEYAKELRDRGCTQIFLYGLAFNGKEVKIALAEEASAL